MEQRFLHPANAEELSNTAKEIGADVIRGPLRYPSESGSWQLGDVDLGEHLWQYRDCEVTVIIAVTGKHEEQIVCGICGFVMDELGDCPRCKLINQTETRARHEEVESMLQEVEEILRDEKE